MLFAIHCLDHPDAAVRRVAHYDAHKAHLASAGGRLVIAGPLLAEDGDSRIGSLLLIEAASLDETRDFNKADPFRLNGVWSTVRIHPFLLLTQQLPTGSARAKA